MEPLAWVCTGYPSLQERRDTTFTKVTLVPGKGIAPLFVGSKPTVLSVELTRLVAATRVALAFSAYETG